MSLVRLLLTILFTLHCLEGCIAVLPFFPSSETFPCEYPFCSNGTNCADERCSGCLFNCFRGEDPAQCRTDSSTCGTHCTPKHKSKKCSDCIHSKPLVPIESRCPLGTFRDYTKSVFSGEDSAYWFDWFRPGKPAQYFSSPTMVDIDGDSVLDFFHAMHGKASSIESNRRIALGSTVMNTTDPQQSLHFKDISSRIIVEDSDDYGVALDKHGEIVADLDNDGYLDIFIVSGGMKGGGNVDEIITRDNFLLFGEKDVDEDSGEEVTIFRGGRMQAEQAGIEGRWGRGRFPYLLDVNQDGLLDIFFAQPRREDNNLAPGSLYINQGNRTWRKDPGLAEFSEAVILTDADGDSIAEEVMMIRGFCFPRRRDPNHDDLYGPFPDHVNQFCSTRPVGSYAIFKFNNSTKQMEEISPKYMNISTEESMQPECCRHGTRESFDKECSAVSIASSDFDGDSRADHIVLYAKKLVFFFSSDRPVGELPIYKKYIGLTIALPPMCTHGNSMQLVDMDNSGKLDIVVTCINTATILIYSQGDEKNSWKLHDNCHDNGSLGDIVFSTFEVTQDDILEACKKRQEIPKYDQLLCTPYEQGKIVPPMQNGATFADINNDGFTDVIIGTKTAYQKFFLYEPSPQSEGNEHISFRLVGDGRNVNLYGIGSTIILYTQIEEGLVNGTQFREISSYQHISDKSGHQDEKVIFGLSKVLNPVKLVTKWPNGIEQTLWLTKFNSTVTYYPSIEIRYPDLGGYFRIKSKKLSDDGETLCLSTRMNGGKLMKLVELSSCTEGANEKISQHFSFSKEGMLISRKLPGYCLMPKSDKVVVAIKCDSILDRHSWHQTQDGMIRLSGSNMVLSCPEVDLKKKPLLEEMNKAQEGQQWALDEVNQLPCIDDEDRKFFFKKKKGQPKYMRCKWLNSLREDRILHICKHRKASNDGRGPAREVCCDTCSKYLL